MGKTSAERTRKYRERMSAEKKKEFKEKNCKQQKKSRNKWTISRKKKEAEKSKIRMRKMRQLMKMTLNKSLEENRPGTSCVVQSPYRNEQSFSKAVNRVKKVLPQSPRKKIAVIKKLAVQVNIPLIPVTSVLMG